MEVCGCAVDILECSVGVGEVWAKIIVIGV